MTRNILSINGLPYLKVAVRTDQNFYDITINSSFKLFDNNNKLIHTETKMKSVWRFKMINRPKKINVMSHYIIKEFYLKDDAKILQSEINDIETEIYEVGGDIYFEGKYLNNNRKYLLLTSKKYTDQEINSINRSFSNKFNLQKCIGLNDPIESSIEIFDSTLSKNITVNNALRVELDEQSAEIAINNIEEFDRDYERYYHKNYHLIGNFEICVNKAYNLDFINVISSEQFIHRVIFSELGNDMPLEFYKSMAVVCRCYIVNRIGQVNMNENYDFHSSKDHLFFNPVRYKNELIDTAIQNTKFEALYYDDDVCQAFYSIVCGGICEDGNEVLSLHKKLNYSAHIDSTIEALAIPNLTIEENVVDWIQSSPNVLCNLHSLEDMPPQLKLGKKYFRWEEYVSVAYLEKRAKEITNNDFGFLVDIMPLKRGKSGRITEIEILGSHQNITIVGESVIRKLFSKTELPSSSFYIEREYDDQGFINELILRGAGFGHGSGLCKTGAAIMAENGEDYKSILDHYFKSAEIRKIF
jgi:stage II sporulation protein D